ncbi:Serine carboxypeptidase-like 19 [Platanthera guangdongensis]|uniref:Serine carboxypeptidase-like 19 n=1 Tax=Platanthera guangdongensis TaxID=2320717 RepID=A0ABR2M4G4_9ASPA
MGVKHGGERRVEMNDSATGIIEEDEQEPKRVYGAERRRLQWPWKPDVGYISGNPVTGALIDDNSRVSYSHGMGILSDELFEQLFLLQLYIPAPGIKSRVIPHPPRPLLVLPAEIAPAAVSPPISHLSSAN